MQGLEKFLNKYLGPIANYMASNKFFGSLSEAFMRTTPVTVGAAMIMIVGNFPYQGWLDFLSNIGLTDHFNGLVAATTGIISLFIVFNFSYTYANKSNQDGLSAGLISLASFFIVMPSLRMGVDYEIASTAPEIYTEIFPMFDAFSQYFTGGMAIFTAIIVASITSFLFVKMNEKGLGIKLPESVPSNVSASLSPSIIATIIFVMWFIIRVGFSYTPFHSLQNIVGIFTLPLQNFVTNPFTMIIFFMIANMLWFFGIHPNMLYGLIFPMMLAILPENIEAFNAGRPIPHLLLIVVYLGSGNAFGGQGGTYGFLISSFTAKSERYKSLRKLAIVPSVFNINEPIIFGAPIMMNPDFFIPMVFGQAVMSAVGIGLVYVLGLTQVNPTAQLPWTTPGIVQALMTGGLKYAIIALSMIVVNAVIWYPFFRIADNRAYAEEQEYDRLHKK